MVGETLLDLSSIEQIIDVGQAKSIAQSLRLLGPGMDGNRTVTHLLDGLEKLLAADGIDALSPYREPDGSLAMPRRYELAAALNRLQTLRTRED
jgi:hypothetical protein